MKEEELKAARKIPAVLVRAATRPLFPCDCCFPGVQATGLKTARRGCPWIQMPPFCR